MRKHGNRLAAALCAALLVTLSARAEDKKSGAPADDKDFVTKAALCGYADVQFGQLADKNAASDKVKEFARMMVKDHAKANEELAAFAKAQRVVVAASLPKDKQGDFDRLSKLQGAEFDREYMKMMVAAHERAVQLFEGEAKSAADADLKKFAEMTLPTIREHLVQARTINETLKDNREKGK